MTRGEAEAILGWMSTLWPRWHVAQMLTTAADGAPETEPGLVDEWLRALEGMPCTPDEAKAAVREVLRKSNYHPTMARITESLQMILYRGQRRPEATGPVAPGVWVQCMATTAQGYETGRPALYGRWHGLWYASGTVYDEQEQVRHAEVLRDFLAGQEGGDWQIIRSLSGPVTEREMMERFCQMRRKAGLLRPHPRAPRQTTCREHREDPSTLRGVVDIMLGR